MRIIKTRIHFQGFAQLLYCFVVATREIVNSAQSAINGEGEGIKLERALQLADRLIESS